MKKTCEKHLLIEAHTQELCKHVLHGNVATQRILFIVRMAMLLLAQYYYKLISIAQQDTCLVKTPTQQSIGEEHNTRSRTGLAWVLFYSTFLWSVTLFIPQTSRENKSKLILSGTHLLRIYTHSSSPNLHFEILSHQHVLGPHHSHCFLML